MQSAVPFFLFSAAVSGAALASEPLPAEQLKALLVGKSVEGFRHDRGVGYDSYIRPDGRVVAVNEKGQRNEGPWRIENDGRFCTQVGPGEELCTRVVPGPDGTYQQVLDNGTVSHTMKKIVDGNIKNL